MNVATMAGGVCLVLAGDAVLFRPTFSTRARRSLRRGYDTSAWTAATRRRLAAACIEYTPSEWLLARALLSVPAAVIFMGLLGGSLVGSALAASSLVRTGTSVFLRVRRGRRTRVLDRLASSVAMALAAELSTGHGAGYALSVAAASSRGANNPLLARVLVAAARAQQFGAPPASALLAGVDAAGARCDALVLICEAFGVLGEAGGDGAPLLRIATAIDRRRRVRDEAHAAATEIRLAAATIPVLGGLVLTAVLTSDPPARTVAGSPLGAALLAACMAIALAGVWLVHRVTR